VENWTWSRHRRTGSRSIVPHNSSPRGALSICTADPAAFERIIDVNLTAMWRMSRAALASMRERRRGAIVNVSSAASFAGGFQVAYQVSKARPGSTA
jgi:NAD(P)-dependent dehydrogenase (short-subunit alcohol dehydrogenase family)